MHVKSRQFYLCSTESEQKLSKGAFHIQQVLTCILLLPLSNSVKRFYFSFLGHCGNVDQDHIISELNVIFNKIWKKNIQITNINVFKSYIHKYKQHI